MDSDTNPDLKLITDPDPTLHLISDPAGFGSTTLPVRPLIYAFALFNEVCAYRHSLIKT